MNDTKILDKVVKMLTREVDRIAKEKIDFMPMAPDVGIEKISNEVLTMIRNKRASQ